MEITRETKIEDLGRFFHRAVCSCGANIGEDHYEDCDVARCRDCGDQAWVSDCGLWNPDTWTGFWPGTLEAVRKGYFCYWGPDYGENGWKECDESHPGAQPDLNRLALDKHL